MPGIKWADYLLSEPKPRTRTLTHAEEARIEEHLREGYGAAFRFAIKSGFRLSNFTEAFTLDQVDFVTRKITIRQKGNREHTVIMTADIEAILGEQVGRVPKLVVEGG